MLMGLTCLYALHHSFSRVEVLPDTDINQIPFRQQQGVLLLTFIHRPTPPFGTEFSCLLGPTDPCSATTDPPPPPSSLLRQIQINKVYCNISLFTTGLLFNNRQLISKQKQQKNTWSSYNDAKTHARTHPLIRSSIKLYK